MTLMLETHITTYPAKTSGPEHERKELPMFTEAMGTPRSALAAFGLVSIRILGKIQGMAWVGVCNIFVAGS